MGTKSVKNFGHSNKMTHISQILHVAHEVALGVDDLVDRFLSLALLVRYARCDFR